ncbi:hypothetical protein SO802_033857 [Lithocarpus litseifolius]|uniref:Aminotransferase-like plant mobile domain-containing protein n=1 Tax=Lithocarpus litseifolius TaxID=425828 RepID=A0AAW2BGD1_9ROSI
MEGNQGASLPWNLGLLRVFSISILNCGDQGASLPRYEWKDTHEYKDLQLLLALLEQFWDTTSIFHFPSIGEVILTPYDFSVITGLRLGSERIKVNDFLTSKEIKKLLGMMPLKRKTKNVSLMWLYKNIENCKIVATGTPMSMLLFIGTFLCLDLGSTMSLRYLWSLKDIDQIKNYDWGGLDYATLLHFMTQFSRRSLSSLGGAPFVWMYEYFGVGPQVLEDVGDMFPRFLHWLPKYRLSVPSKSSLQVWCMVIDNLTVADVLKLLHHKVHVLLQLDLISYHGV